MGLNSIVQLLGVYKIKGTFDIHLLELNINTSPADVDVSSFTQEDDTLQNVKPKAHAFSPWDEGK